MRILRQLELQVAWYSPIEGRSSSVKRFDAACEKSHLHLSIQISFGLLRPSRTFVLPTTTSSGPSASSRSRRLLRSRTNCIKTANARGHDPIQPLTRPFKSPIRSRNDRPGVDNYISPSSSGGRGVLGTGPDALSEGRGRRWVEDDFDLHWAFCLRCGEAERR